MFRSIGCDVEPHSSVRDTQRRPDFRMHSAHGSFLVEAVASEEDISPERNKAQWRATTRPLWPKPSDAIQRIALCASSASVHQAAFAAKRPASSRCNSLADRHSPRLTLIFGRGTPTVGSNSMSSSKTR